MSYSVTETTLPDKDGRFSPVEPLVVKAGDVIRVFDGPFGDAVVLGFDEQTGEPKLARPYVYASSVGYAPVPLVGTEVYTMTLANLRAILVNNPKAILQRNKVVT